MRFDGSQTVVLYLVLPFGTTLDTISSIRSNYQKLPGLRQAFPGLRLLQVAGDADVVLIAQPASFRSIFSIEQLLDGTSPLSLQWSFGKGYALHRTLADEDGEALPETAPVSFLTYLRLYRKHYRALGVDAEIQVAAAIENLLQRHGIDAALSAAVGWPDLFLISQRPCNRSRILSLVTDLESVKVTVEDESLFAFSRDLTILGYDRTDDEPYPVAHATPSLLGFQLAPGSAPWVLPPLKALMGELGDGPADFDWASVEGRTRLLARPQSGLKRVLDLHLDGEHHARLLALRDLGLRSAISYIAYSPTPDFSAEAHTTWCNELSKCSCATRSPMLQLGDLDGEPAWGASDGRLARGLIESVRTIYNLFRAALNDPTQCCDLVDLVEACDRTLLSILNDLRRINSGHLRLAEDDTFNRRERLFAEVKEWCSRVEKVLSERTSDSFRALTGHSNRLSSLRGNVRKNLLTADRLVAEFLERACNLLSVAPPVPPPVYFYGATDAIESHLRAGVVTVPSKYMFCLPLAIPQLLQEAGVLVFNYLYDPLAEEDPLTPKIEAYLESLSDLRQKKSGYPFPTPLGHEDLRRFLSDLFADLLVRFLGFRSDLDHLRYLVTLMLENHEFELAPRGRKQAFWADTLQRLLFVFECGRILERKKLLRHQTEPEQSLQLPLQRKHMHSVANDRRVYLKKCIGDITKMIDREVLNTPQYQGRREDLAPTREIIADTLDRALLSGFVICHCDLMWTFIEGVETHRSVPTLKYSDQRALERNITQMHQGNILKVDAGHLNAHFIRGHIEEVKIRLEEPPAALGGEASAATGRPSQRNPKGLAALERAVLLSSYQDS